MDAVADRAFVCAMPKAELHMHIEGSLEPELLFRLAQKNGVTIPFKSVDEVRKAYSFSCLQDFLNMYERGMCVLTHEEDFYELAMEYFGRISKDGVVHTEIMFDPQGHTERGVSFETVITGLARAQKDAEAKFLITSKLIMCYHRHLSEEAAITTLEQSKPFKHLIAAVGLDSTEKGHPPAKFAKVYQMSKEIGFRLVAHAGEEGPAQNIIDALDILKAERIDHGLSAREDPALISRLAKSRVGLTTCPLSNQKLQATPDLATHPAQDFLTQGVAVSLNSDDPAYFGGYILDNYMAMIKARNLTRAHVVKIAVNSIETSFLSADQVAAWKIRIDQLVAAVLEVSKK